MGKDRLAARQDLWSTRRLPPSLGSNGPQFSADHARRTVRPGASAISFKAFRAASPFVMPFMMGGASYILLVLVLLGASDTVHAVSGPEVLGPLFFLFAAVAVILVAAMAYAPNEAIWALAMIGGLIVYAAMLTWAIFGLPAALALLAGLALLLVVIVRSQMHTVLENTVHVMVFFGKYNRTLLPGFHLRMPGEQVLAIIATSERLVEVTLHDMILLDGKHIDISATAACHVAPENAHLLVYHVADEQAHAADWLALLQQYLELVLRQTLTDTRADEIAADLEADVPMGVRIKGGMRPLAGRMGIQVEWVRLHSIRPVPEEPTLRVPTGSAPPYADVQSPVGHGGPAASIPLPDPQPTMQRGITPGALLHLPPAMQADMAQPAALVEAYNAVRERRITDPRTIQRIALAFEKVAQDPVLGPHLPFDGATAALNLRQLAEKEEIR